MEHVIILIQKLKLQWLLKSIYWSKELKLNGYKYVNLSKNNKTKTYRVHRLVAKAFIDNPEKLPQINHIDENKSNNQVNNLEWCTAKYNVNYGDRNFKAIIARGMSVKCIETRWNLSVCTWSK